ncbi:MAG TPA: hypothetical protein VIV57_26390 [Anaeromyxobacter sp.]
MPRKIKARDGDTLCGIAIRCGFVSCDPLRKLKENDALKKRALVAGDVVTVPDKKKKDEKAPTGKTTKLSAKGGLEPRIRFVHGSKKLPYAKDPTLESLDISNYVTDKGGADMSGAFPNGYGFAQPGHDDPDTFKVEVVASGAGASPKVLLEALRPVYAKDGKVEKHEQFPAGAERDARKVDLELKRMAGHTTVYRSRYLRLVTDDVDEAKAADQGLLVTDMADGANGDLDKVEILDQHVRASMPVPACKAPEAERCTLRAELPIAKGKKRIRLCVHVFRKTPGGAAVDGLTEKMARRRVFKWFRRAYAQAGFAPKLVDPFVEFIDPPAANMIVIGQDNGLSAAGVDGSGNPSTLSFRLGAPPKGILDPFRRLGDPTVKVTLAAGLSPSAVGAAIVGALPKGYKGVLATNARGFTAPDASCDVLVTKDDGSRVVIRGEGTTDTRLTVEVARVDLARVNDVDGAGHMIPSTVDFRRVIRSAEGKDDRLDYFIIEKFANDGLRGRAFVPATDLSALLRPPAPLRWAVIMACQSSSGKVMDGGDALPFTFPHEAGHVLNDAFHTAGANASTEMMRSGTSPANAVDASKRICDTVHVQYGMFDPAQPTPGAAINSAISAVQRMRARGAPVMEDW